METAEQELEALKSWWQENGRTLIVGVALGLTGVFGWTWWQDHTRTQAEDASLIYQKLTEEAAASNHEAVRAQAAAIIDTYPKSGYAALAALLAAKSAYEENDLERAERQLEWVIDNAQSDSFKNVARLRLARVLIQENKLDQAMATVDAVDTEAFSASANEIRGDILLVKGDGEGARAAYLEALGATHVSGTTRARVQMKLDDLGASHADSVSG